MVRSARQTYRRHPERSRRALLQGRGDGEERAMARLGRNLAAARIRTGSRIRARTTCCRSTSSSICAAFMASSALADAAVALRLSTRRKGKVEFAKLLVEAAGSVERGIGFFGGMRTSKGRIDLKRTGLFGIVSSARALAIRHHILERSTSARLRGVRGLRIGGESDLDRADRCAGGVPGFGPVAAARGYSCRPAGNQHGVGTAAVGGRTRTADDRIAIGAPS